MINNQLPRSTPEKLGIFSAGIVAFLNAIDRQAAQPGMSRELHSLMIVRHGQVAAEGWWAPYGPRMKHHLFSLSKSFTSTAIGLAVKEGRITLEDSVASFFQEELPEKIGKNLAAMRIKHLLSMTSGHGEDPLQAMYHRHDGNWVAAFLSQPVEFEPGTHFLYNNGATFMLSAILQKVTGQTVTDYLRPRLFEPLGIEGAEWEVNPQGIVTGAFGLNIKTEDIARLGLLYLNRGLWNGERILSEAWVEDATSQRVSNGTSPHSDWEQGYGYQFWMCRHGAYRADGAFGQFCIVLPEKDAVIVMTSATDNTQTTLNLVWEYLLPAMNSDPLPAYTASDEALLRKLSNLEAPMPQGSSFSTTASEVSGQWYEMEVNDEKIERVSFDFGRDSCTIHQLDISGEQRFDCGYEKWISGVDANPPNLRERIKSKGWSGGDAALRPNGFPIAARGLWKDENTFVLVKRFLETPFYQIIVYCFEKGGLSMKIRINVSFENNEPPLLRGRPVV